MPTPFIDEKASVDFSTLTIPGLLEEAQRLALVLDLANSQRRDIFALVEQRKAEAIAQLRAMGMGPAAKDAMLTVLQGG